MKVHGIQGIECRRVCLECVAFLENDWDMGWDNLGEHLNFSSLEFLLRFKSSAPPTLCNTYYFNIILFCVFFWGRTNSCKHLYLNGFLNWHPPICHFFVKNISHERMTWLSRSSHVEDIFAFIEKKKTVEK